MNKNNGFTLIELMIVVVIVGLLAAVAYPSYQNSLIKARRSDAQGALQGLAQAMERNYTTNGTYAGAATAGADTGAPTIFSVKSPIDGNATYYNLKIVVAGATGYTLGAEPIGIQSGDGVLILTSTGARGWDVDDDANGTAAADSIESTEWCWKEGC